MLDKRLKAAQMVAAQLHATEAAIDAALASAAELNAVLPRARCDANLSAVVGNEVFGSAAASLTALVNARSAIVLAHQQLTETKDKIGLRARAFGGGYVKPEASAQPLHLVDNAA